MYILEAVDFHRNGLAFDLKSSFGQRTLPDRLASRPYLVYNLSWGENPAVDFITASVQV